MVRILVRRVLVYPLAGLLAACSESSGANTHDFAGDWQYVEVLTDLPKGIACTDTGVYHFNQMGTAVHGYYIQRGICSTPGGFVNNADSDAVFMGRVLGHTLEFRASLYCDYDGTLDLNTGILSGVGICMIPRTSDTVALQGTWTATR